MMKFNYFFSLLISYLLLGVFCLSLTWSMFLSSGCEIVLEWEAMVVNSSSVILLLVVDWVSVFFLSTVSLIAGSVMFYSSSYMSSDVYYSRFIGLVIMFVISMWILVLSPNFISILLGWDGLGVTSYLLVIYYQSEKSFNAGMITALTNRLGDAGLLIMIGLVFQVGGWSFFYYSWGGGWYTSSLLGLLIVVAMTKSAQIPFSAWLPAAMAAPTPVSSLVHSSTLVTAGVYLLVRMNYLLAESGALWGLALLGAMTMFMAGMSAMHEVDMKKIIALSTLSQLGLMFMTLGMGLPLLTFFHLIAHAYFKAMLFMSAGSVIHSLKDYQDLRTMGGVMKVLPVSASIFFVANISLCGVPFMTGFFSKDLILELMMMSSVSVVLFTIAMVATMLTVMYSFRIFSLVFLGSSGSEACFSMSETDKIMLYGMLFLLLPSIFGGALISWSLFSYSYLVFLPLWLKFLILGLIFSAVMIMMKKENLNYWQSGFVSFIHFMWFMPFMFSRAATNISLGHSNEVFKKSESGWTFFMMTMVFKHLNLMLSNYLSLGLAGGFLKSVFSSFYSGS